jgi:hypothetical protein
MVLFSKLLNLLAKSWKLHPSDYRGSAYPCLSTSILLSVATSKGLSNFELFGSEALRHFETLMRHVTQNGTFFVSKAVAFNRQNPTKIEQKSSRKLPKTNIKSFSTQDVCAS